MFRQLLFFKATMVKKVVSMVKSDKMIRSITFLEDGTAPGHQLVCRSCMVSMPSMQVGKCDCLVCRLCMDMMDRLGFCKNCNIHVRYTELERIIRFPDKGKVVGQLFRVPREREDFSTLSFSKGS